MNLDKIYNSKIFDSPFMERFRFNAEMLDYRMHRLMSINAMVPDNKMEYQMVFDSVMVLFRSMFLEKLQKNYTFQNFFSLTAREVYAREIDDFLDRPFIPSNNQSIRTVLKFISDKFICHQDSVKPTDIGLCDAYIAHLCNPCFDNNLSKIYSGLQEIVSRALKDTD